MTDVRGALEELATGSRFGKFVSVGAAGAVVDFTVSSASTLGGVLEPHWAKLVGAETAIVLMFLVNDAWTFGEQGAPGLPAKLRRLLTSNAVRSGGLTVQLFVVWFLAGLDVEVVVAGANVWAVLTMPVAIGLSFAVNYVAESLLTWRVAGGTDPAER